MDHHRPHLMVIQLLHPGENALRCMVVIAGVGGDSNVLIAGTSGDPIDDFPDFRMVVRPSQTWGVMALAGKDDRPAPRRGGDRVQVYRSSPHIGP